MVVLLALAFILELVAFVGFAGIGFCFHLSLLLEIAIGIVLFIGLIVFWSLYMAPKATKKFSPTAYYIAKVIIYAIAAFTIFDTNKVVFGLLFIGLSCVDEITLFRHNIEK